MVARALFVSLRPSPCMARHVHGRTRIDTDEDEMGTQNTPDEPHRPDARQDLPHPEAALGGADNVEKTTYVTGKGTEPSGSNRKGEPVARVGGGGMGIGGWVLILVVLAIAVLYGGSLFR